MVVLYRPDAAVLAVDPANRCGWSFWLHGALVASGVLPPVTRDGGAMGVDVKGSYRVFRQFQQQANAAGEKVGVLVVEQQFPKGDMGQFESLQREIEARQTWECWAVLHDWRIERVFPSTWQSATGLGRVRSDRKRNSLVVASKIVGRQVQDDNEADAVLLGSFAVRRARASEAVRETRAGR